MEPSTSNAEPRTKGNGAGHECGLRSGGAAAGIFGADYPAGGAAAEHPRGQPRRQPVAAVGHVAAPEPRGGARRGVWSPGFSRSDAVSSWISKCFEQPSGDSPVPAKAGTPYTEARPRLLQRLVLIRSL